MRSPPPLVSIALATYNGKRFIEEQLASVEAQTYPNLEIVVSDDASGDGTREWLEARSWRRPHRLVQGGARGGVVANFSRALHACRGEYLALCDQDDFWAPDKIEALMSEITSLEDFSDNPSPTLVFSDIEVTDAALETTASSFFELDRKSKRCAHLADFVLANHVPGCAMLFNRALLDKACPIPPRFHMHDWWLIMTAATFGRVGCVDRPLIKYRQHDTNTLGAVNQRSSRAEKLAKAFELDAWRTYLLPSDERVVSTMRNLTTFEERFASLLPAEAHQLLGRFHRRIGLASALGFFLRARTGESLIFSVALQRAVARLLRDQDTDAAGAVTRQQSGVAR